MSDKEVEGKKAYRLGIECGGASFWWLGKESRFLPQGFWIKSKVVVYHHEKPNHGVAMTENKTHRNTVKSAILI